MLGNIKGFISNQVDSIGKKTNQVYKNIKITVVPFTSKSYDWVVGTVEDSKGFISKQAKTTWKQAKHISVESAMAVSTVLSTAWSHNIAQWLADTFNRVPGDVYDKAIDSAAHIGGSHLHHLVDGQHTIIGAFQAAHDAIPGDSFIQETFATAEHLFRDLCSVTGINPVFSVSKDTYDNIAGFLKDTFHIPKSWTSDMLTINGAEVLASTFVVLPLIFGWSNKQSKRFAEMAGSYGISSIINANPLLGLISLIALAKAYTQAENSQEKEKVVDSTTKGSIFSTIVLGTSAIIGGPVWMGLILGIVIAFIVRNKLSKVDLINGLREFLDYFYEQFICPVANKISSELEYYYRTLRVKVSPGRENGVRTRLPPKASLAKGGRRTGLSAGRQDR